MKIRLSVKPTPTEEFSWDYEGTSFDVGRSGDCPLRLSGGAGQLVSGRHVRVESVGGEVIVSDLGSTNGTYLNDQPLLRSAVLRKGDEIALGRGGPRLRVRFLEVAPWLAQPPPTKAAGTAASAGGATTQLLVAHMRQQNRVLLFTAVAIIGIVLVGGAVLTLRNDGGELTPAAVLNVPATQTISQPLPDSDSSPKTNASPEPLNANPPKLEPAEIATRYGDAIVWLGVRLEGQLWPLCTAWAIQPKIVVSTGREIAALKRFQEEGNEVVAVSLDRPDRPITVSSLRPHPQLRYKPGDEEGPPPETDLLYNLGIAELSTPLEVYCQVRNSSDLRGDLVGAPIVTLAFAHSTVDGDLQPVGALTQPKFASAAGRVQRPRQLPNNSGGLPLLELDISAEPGADGAPIFDGQGCVMGVLMRIGERRLAVFCDELRALTP